MDLSSPLTNNQTSTSKKPRFKQIAGYLTQAEHETFSTYAEWLGISSSALLNPLIRRELHLLRLESLRTVYPRPACADPLRKVIAHLQDSSLNTAFAHQSSKCTLAVATAAGTLMRAELSERWLLKAVQKSPETI
jgi:hypothetical protein